MITSLEGFGNVPVAFEISKEAKARNAYHGIVDDPT